MRIKSLDGTDKSDININVFDNIHVYAQKSQKNVFCSKNKPQQTCTFIRLYVMNAPSMRVCTKNQ